MTKRFRPEPLVITERVTPAEVEAHVRDLYTIARFKTPVYRDTKTNTSWWADYRVFKSDRGHAYVIERRGAKQVGEGAPQYRRSAIRVAVNAWLPVMEMLSAADHYVRKHEKEYALSDTKVGMDDSGGADYNDDAAVGETLHLLGGGGEKES